VKSRALTGSVITAIVLILVCLNLALASSYLNSIGYFYLLKIPRFATSPSEVHRARTLGDFRKANVHTYSLKFMMGVGKST
jgi:hypothetical protein